MSTGPDHERWGDAAGTYVLGALPDDERAAYETHLETCTACRDEVEELRIAADALPVSAPAMRPSPALKARIMAEVEREAALLAAAGPQADRPPRERRRRWRERFTLPMPALAALASAALLVGIGAGALIFKSGGGSSSQVAFVADPKLAPKASAMLERGADQSMVVAHGLPAPRQGRVYQVWLKKGDKLVPTDALFMPRGDGSASASVAGDLHGVDAVVVNTEPDGGSDTPTGQPVLTATLT